MKCDHCGYDLPQLESALDDCPRCQRPVASTGQNQPSQPQLPWVTVARMNGLAEIGFVADALEASGVTTQIHQETDFSAIDGAWRISFLLRVPRDESQAAIDILKQEAAAFDAEDPAEWREQVTRSRRQRAMMWQSVAFVLLAGGLAYTAGRFGLMLGSQQAGPIDPLWRAIRESNQVFQTRPVPGEVTSRIWYDRAAGSVVLEQDANDDGIWELRRTFSEPR